MAFPNGPDPKPSFLVSVSVDAGDVGNLPWVVVIGVWALSLETCAGPETVNPWLVQAVDFSRFMAIRNTGPVTWAALFSSPEIVLRNSVRSIVHAA